MVRKVKVAWTSPDEENDITCGIRLGISVRGECNTQASATKESKVPFVTDKDLLFFWTRARALLHKAWFLCVDHVLMQMLCCS